MSQLSPEARARVGSPERVENALLQMLGYHERDGTWMHPGGNRLDGGREEALDEACTDVELGRAEPYCPVCYHHHTGPCSCADCGRDMPCPTHGS